MKIKTLIRRNPLTTYFVLALAISAGGSFAAGGPMVLRGEIMPMEIGLLVFAAMMAGPSLAGLLMTVLMDGRQGLKLMFDRMLKWRVKSRWYAAMLIFPALILALLLFLRAQVSREFTPIFLSISLIFGPLAGFIEEIGWTGFATPRLLKKGNALTAGLFLGFIHALYHLSADFLGNSITFGSYWIYYMVGFSAFVIALRIIIVWVYVNTESLLLAQLMHASSTGFLVMLTPTDIAPVNWAVFYIAYAVVVGAAALVVVLAYGTDLVRRPLGSIQRFKKSAT